jgi:hypothetical protein
MTSWYGGWKAGNLWIRIFLGDGKNDVYIIEFVHRGFLEFRYGLSHLEKIVSSLPGVQYGVPLSLKLSRLLDYSPHTFASGTYLGLVYIDFGLIGVAILYFFMGGIVGHLQAILFGRKKEILNLILVAMIIVSLGQMYSGGPRRFMVALLVILSFHTIFRICGSFYKVCLLAGRSSNNIIQKKPLNTRSSSVKI